MKCEMETHCTAPVTHLDNNGFIYCTTHGIQRRHWKPCRKLRTHELNRIRQGLQITKY